MAGVAFSENLLLMSYIDKIRSSNEFSLRIDIIMASLVAKLIRRRTVIFSRFGQMKFI